MQLTILGNNGPYPAPGGACSGYLLSHGDTHVLVDCGLGVLANLQKYLPLEALSAVVFTHLHFDHTADGLNLPVTMQANGLPCPPMYAPATPEPVRALLPQAKFQTRFSVGEMAFELFPARHPVEAYSIRVECAGRRLVLTGDTNWHDELVEICRGAHLLLADSAFYHREWTEQKPHLSARLCGKLARKAGVDRLVLTHLFPKNDPIAYAREAAEEFEAVSVAAVGAVYSV